MDKYGKEAMHKGLKLTLVVELLYALMLDKAPHTAHNIRVLFVCVLLVLLRL